MYRFLREGVVKYKEQTHRLATLTMEGRGSKAAKENYKLELERRLHNHLDKRCLVTRKGNRIYVDIVGSFSGRNWTTWRTERNAFGSGRPLEMLWIGIRAGVEREA